MAPNIIIGNLCTLLAMGSNAISSTKKTAKGILIFQSVSQGIYFVCAIVLRGYSAAVQNVVSIIRNIVAIKNIKSKVLEWILIILGVILGVVFNNRGIIGLLPVIGNLQYTLAIFWLKYKEKLFKISFLISTVAFALFNLEILNFVGAIADTIVSIITIIALIKGTSQKPEKEKRKRQEKN